MFATSIYFVVSATGSIFFLFEYDLYILQYLPQTNLCNFFVDFRLKIKLSNWDSEFHNKSLMKERPQSDESMFFLEKNKQRLYFFPLSKSSSYSYIDIYDAYLLQNCSKSSAKCSTSRLLTSHSLSEKTNLREKFSFFRPLSPHSIK